MARILIGLVFLEEEQDLERSTSINVALLESFYNHLVSITCFIASTTFEMRTPTKGDG